jgi:mono/diheme cytochrome c family protein
MTKHRPRFIDKYFWPGLIVVITVGLTANLLIWFWPNSETTSSSPNDIVLPSYPVEQVRRGRDLYAATCATCHGANGAGYAQATIPAPALNGSMHAWHHTDDQIRSWIRGGLGQMPAVGATWSDEDIDAVIAYVKQWWEPEQLAWQTATTQQNSAPAQ